MKFAPTGEQFAAATTEGLLIYSLNSSQIFDPWDLQIDITPSAIRKAIDEQDHLQGKNFNTQPFCFKFFNFHFKYFLALTMALKLNETDLIRQAIETVPVNDGSYVILFNNYRS